MPLPEVPENEKRVIKAWWCDYAGVVHIEDMYEYGESRCNRSRHLLDSEHCRMMLVTPEFIEGYKGLVFGELEDS